MKRHKRKKRGKKMPRRYISPRLRIIAYAILAIMALLFLGLAGKYECEDIETEAAGYEEERVLIQGHPTEIDPEDGEERQFYEIVTRNATPPVMEAKEAWIPDDTPELDAECDQFEELVQIVMAEGGNTEPELGIALICDAILNRVDSSFFPDNIHDVIYQKGQFQPVGDGTLYRFTPTEKVIRICAREMESRTSTSVLFFKTKSYHKGTTPIMKVGHHYYSGR